MIVEEIMKTDVATLTIENTIEDAVKLMENKKIRHIPILDINGILAGLVTDRDIRAAMPSIFHFNEHLDELKNPLKSIMKTDLITGHPLDFVEEIAALFYEHHIGCLPIVSDEKLAGIVTETDMLHTLVELTGALQPGSQIEVKVPNKSGMLCNIASVISSRNANILSVLVYPDRKDENYKILVVRIQTMNPIGIIEDLKKAGHDVLWPNLPGVSS
ncbi:acetoin utilization AcuB family protein [Mesobacillus zeae]|uniref:CBS domain-containing protein n=1 Tax=Mesobacillus zeae TaxID=1917180 RepID=A0A398B583_9BACI|nr:acetoin utilization AcuB family protein [Mesobacillus zeae]RID83110.1 CBS domain-containing protein [Mesobacillus zeae]